jgi:hypothetical protein
MFPASSAELFRTCLDRAIGVQLTDHDFLKNLGVSLIPATAPDFFTEDTPTAVLVRQVLGAIAHEKSSLVAKLKAARDRKIAAGEKELCRTASQARIGRGRAAHKVIGRGFWENLYHFLSRVWILAGAALAGSRDRRKSTNAKTPARSAQG